MMQKIMRKIINSPLTTGILSTHGVVAYIAPDGKTFNTFKGVFPKEEFMAVSLSFIHTNGDEFFLGGDLRDDFLEAEQIEEDAVDARCILGTWVCWHRSPPSSISENERLIDQIKERMMQMATEISNQKDYIRILEQEVRNATKMDPFYFKAMQAGHNYPINYSVRFEPENESYEYACILNHSKMVGKKKRDGAWEIYDAPGALQSLLAFVDDHLKKRFEK